MFVSLEPGLNFEFRPVNPAGDTGAVLYFQENYMPRPWYTNNDIVVVNRLPEVFSRTILCNTDVHSHLAIILVAHLGITHIQIPGDPDENDDPTDVLTATWAPF